MAQTHYVGHYFGFQTSFVIFFFQMKYFNLKLLLSSFVNQEKNIYDYNDDDDEFRDVLLRPNIHTYLCKKDLKI